MELKDLRPAEGSTKNRKRVGRGPASGTGKTAGRGMNGQKSRAGGGKGAVSMPSSRPETWWTASP